ncbi:siderophore biosynthesis protein, putative [Talaromyces stipitatus ATCC 10500]|uniref:Siderophore biosynthesis protein, putative n=1 Tax=Talaromyces stipitatus (strain ATCC 10500 / CBS 375.48 / QM 6759 / NRRL 1006) TaxID=441959 RepID=B8MGL8_TALSN|nr:siderophore biosynthesis protein, putative [Talaromyces stipitatus ATCC 10500]EED16769.1 siderophore biosynthesis protein, putative [Talaromyces stipitatus ATCC 10500]
MPSSTCHLPNGHTFSVTPVFGGVTFKEIDACVHNPAFPPGWTVVIHTEKLIEEDHANEERKSHEENNTNDNDNNHDTNAEKTTASEPKVRISAFRKPTLRNDCIFISSINDPSDFKTPVSPSRQIAMMLWATLWWYFHEPEPDLHLLTEASAGTAESGRPKGEWRVNIKREGVFKGRNLLQKLERMGLIANEDSSVGIEPLDARNPAHCSRMFASRRSFWQLDPRIFIFTSTPANISPGNTGSLSPVTSPYGSRPASPNLETLRLVDASLTASVDNPPPIHILNTISGPFHSGSHLPTYFPPAPTQYIFTNGVRHPLRQRPPHQGETFYVRYVPSVGQYLSFRVPILNTVKTSGLHHSHSASTASCRGPISPSQGSSDVDLIHKWMNVPRVNAAWGEAGSKSKIEEFLKQGLNSRHSFPVIGCWNGKPFGYFEVYWVKEDRFGRLLNSVGNYDRGLHVLVGEDEFRGAHRVPIWLSSLVHYCWLADPRTETVLLEPRVDNQKLISYLLELGFYKEGEVTFPHKQSAVMKINRDSWNQPAL